MAKHTDVEPIHEPIYFSDRKAKRKFLDGKDISVLLPTDSRNSSID